MVSDVCVQSQSGVSEKGWGVLRAVPSESNMAVREEWWRHLSNRRNHSHVSPQIYGRCRGKWGAPWEMLDKITFVYGKEGFFNVYYSNKLANISLRLFKNLIRIQNLLWKKSTIKSQQSQLAIVFLIFMSVIYSNHFKLKSIHFKTFHLQCLTSKKKIRCWKK